MSNWIPEGLPPDVNEALSVLRAEHPEWVWKIARLLIREAMKNKLERNRVQGIENLKEVDEI